jgi:hypothetical protein
VTLYLHVFDWPEEPVLRVPGIQAKVVKAYLLMDRKQKLSHHADNGDLLIDLPARMPDALNTVIALEIRGEPQVTSNMPSLKDGRVVLWAAFADIHNRGYGRHAVLSGTGDDAVITNWVDPRTRLEWMFSTTDPGTYAVEATLKTNEPATLNITIGDATLLAEIPATRGEFTKVDLGSIDISATVNPILEVRPEAELWKKVELMKLELVKK